MKDIDLVELNEAFAVQALGCIKELEIDLNKCNLNGSGISIGHPSDVRAPGSLTHWRCR